MIVIEGEAEAEGPRPNFCNRRWESGSQTGDDEQLRRFQTELQQLVHALRDWHQHQGRQADRQADKGMVMGELEEMILKY
eukprot:gene27848-36693_t